MRSVFIYLIMSVSMLNTISAYSNEYPLKSAIDEILNENLFNGVIEVTKDNTVIYETAQGKLSSPKKDSQFLIGSISKQMTASILLNLVDQGLVDLDSPISDYLPDLKQDFAKKVKVKNLLDHSSGIIALNKPLAFTPGTKFQYSAIIGFDLASQIAEKTSGKSFKELIREMFTQANMHHSDILISANIKANQKIFPDLIRGYKEIDNKLEEVVNIGEEGEQYNDSWAAGGGIISTSDDLIKWNNFLHQGNFLSKASYLKMISPSQNRDHPRYGNIDYGYGIQRYEYNGLIELSHSGYIDGYIATLLYYPIQKISLVILENISLNSANPGRAFGIQDQVRKIIRNQINLGTYDKRNN